MKVAKCYVESVEQEMAPRFVAAVEELQIQLPCL